METSPAPISKKIKKNEPSTPSRPRLLKSYIYAGIHGEIIPRNAQNVEYAADIKMIKKMSAFNCRCITSVIHPNSIIVIEDYAYSWCYRISYLCLSSLLQTIGVMSFCGCRSIRILELPPTLRTIKKQGFMHCTSLRMITSQEQQEPIFLKKIEEEAFYNCSSLTNIPHLPFLVIIGPWAFTGCSLLTEVTLGPSVTSAARNAFVGCNSLAVLKCTYRAHAILPWAVTHVALDPATTHIHASAFAGCGRLHSIVLPATVISIGPSAFWGCKKLPADFMMPHTVEDIGLGAFARCKINSANLPPHATQDIYTFVGGEGEQAPGGTLQVMISETVDEIKRGAFGVCGKMTHLEIRSKSITIQRGSFVLCSKLKEIEFHINGTFNIEKNAVLECTVLNSVKWPKIVQCIMNGKFGDHALPGDRPPIPVMHENTFRDSSVEIERYCKRYSCLCQFWKWLDKKEKKHNTFRSDCSQYNSYDYLSNDDLDMLQQILKLVPPPPNDLVDAIANYLHSHDLILNRVPKDVIWKVVKYMDYLL